MEIPQKLVIPNWKIIKHDDDDDEVASAAWVSIKNVNSILKQEPGSTLSGASSICAHQPSQDVGIFESPHQMMALRFTTSHITFWRPRVHNFDCTAHLIRLSEIGAEEKHTYNSSEMHPINWQWVNKVGRRAGWTNTSVVGFWWILSRDSGWLH